MTVEELASAIINDTYAGLSGLNSNIAISIDQLSDEIVSMRESVILEYWKKGILQKGDLLKALNCVVVDCKDPAKCNACDKPYNGEAGHSSLHFEIPQLVSGIGDDAIAFVGSADRAEQYKVYFSPTQAKYHKYHRRTAHKPYVYIEKAPNENGMYDGWIFNLPFVKTISVIGVFRDPRQLTKMGCDGNCDNSGADLGIVSMDVKERLTKEKLTYYRGYYHMPRPNDQTPR